MRQSLPSQAHILRAQKGFMAPSLSSTPPVTHAPCCRHILQRSHTPFVQSPSPTDSILSCGWWRRRVHTMPPPTFSTHRRAGGGGDAHHQRRRCSLVSTVVPAAAAPSARHQRGPRYLSPMVAAAAAATRTTSATASTWRRWLRQGLREECQQRRRRPFCPSLRGCWRRCAPPAPPPPRSVDGCVRGRSYSVASSVSAATRTTNAAAAPFRQILDRSS